MVPTFGLTHIALGVRDPERALGFYGFRLTDPAHIAGALRAVTAGRLRGRDLVRNSHPRQTQAGQADQGADQAPASTGRP